MRRTGIAELDLHGGRAPRWLLSRMRRLGDAIATVLVDEYGRREVLRRLADPFWFQCLSNSLAFDWDSSGSTTVLCGVLKSVLRPDAHGLAAAGGKGMRAKLAQKELPDIAGCFNLSEEKADELRYSSRMTAKVDNAAIQAGYSLYHHCMFVSEDGDWVVVQQGMNPNLRSARRYHWFSAHIDGFVEEPHDGIVGDRFHREVLNMTAKESQGCREVCTDLASEGARRLGRMLSSVRPKGQTSLRRWTAATEEDAETAHRVMMLPKRVNWRALDRASEVKPEDYEGLLSVEGIGAATVRGLALVSELLYGESPSWKDPAMFTFAFGGKDGVPFPVKREAMDEASEVIETGVRQAKLGDRDKLESIKRLRRFLHRVRTQKDQDG